MSAPIGQQNGKRNPLYFKEIPLYTKIFKKSFGFPKGFPNRVICLYDTANLDGRMGRILT